MNKLDTGSRLGRYEIVRKIGSGGMADIFLARSPGLSGFEKPVVLKVLRDPLALDEDAVTEFLDEARLAARLSHPNLVSTFEVGNEDGRYFMVMEYVRGESLMRLRSGPGGMSLDLQLAVLVSVLAALEHAHGLADDDGAPLGVVHRDVSASNVMVTIDGHVKLVDFGVARAKTNRHTTRAGTIKGTLRYVAPEAMRGELVDHRADLYAVGVLLWEAMTGERFLEGENAASIMLRVGSGEYPAASELLEVSPLLDLIATRALSSSPAARFASAREMRSALVEYVAQRGPVAREEELGALVRTALAIPSSGGQRARPALISRPPVDPPRPPVDPPRPASVPSLGPQAWGTPSLPPAPGDPSRWAMRPWVRVAVVTSAGLFVASALVAFVPGIGALVRDRHRVAASSTVSATDLTTPSAPAPPPPSAQPSPPAPAEPQMVTINLGVYPRAAQIHLDGHLLDGNPTLVTQAMGTKHTVLATAYGFRPMTVVLAFDQPRTLDLALLPLRKAQDRREGAPLRAHLPRTSGDPEHVEALSMRPVCAAREWSIHAKGHSWPVRGPYVGRASFPEARSRGTSSREDRLAQKPMHSLSPAEDSAALSPSLALAPTLERFVAGRRVAIFGDATSGLAAELASRGARLVHVYDPDGARVASAIVGLPARNVAYAPLGDDLGVRDGAFDVAVVPDLSLFADPRAIVGRARQATASSGVALVATPAAQTSDDPSRLGYYDFYDVLSLQFAEVRMFGRVPFQGVALVDFAEGGAEVTVDASLAGDPPPPEQYVAIASDRPVELDGYTVIQLPAVEQSPRSAADLDDARVGLAEAQAQLGAARAEIERARELRLAAESRASEEHRRSGQLASALAEAELAARTLEARLVEEARRSEMTAGQAARAQETVDRMGRELGQLREAAAKWQREGADRPSREQLAKVEAELARARQREEQVARLEAELARARQREELFAKMEAEVARARSREQQLLAGGAKLEAELGRARTIVANLNERLAQAEAAPRGVDPEAYARLEEHARRLAARLASMEAEHGGVHEAHGAEVTAAEHALRERAREIAALRHEVDRRGQMVRELLAALESGGQLAPAAPVAPNDAELAAARSEIDALKQALLQERQARLAAQTREPDPFPGVLLHQVGEGRG